MLTSRSVWTLSVLALLLPLLLPLGVLSEDDFNLADALDDESVKPSSAGPKPAAPTRGIEVTVRTTTIKAPEKVKPKLPTSTAVSKKTKPKSTGQDFDLSDALDQNQKAGGGFSDSDLEGVSNDNTYKPDKGKGGYKKEDSRQSSHDENSEVIPEVGTIAGIASAVAMALVGAITSYISYQKKKLCFSIQQSLNVDINKAEIPEGVVATEPQAQQTLLEQPKSGPPCDENAV